MIEIKDKKQCCGCEACVQVCPKQCISFKQDTEGFFYPEADASQCINCGLCDKACPMQSQFNSVQPIETLAAINVDEDIRLESSSGGVFTLLAESVIAQGGVVFGVRFDKDFQAVYDVAETPEQLSAFRGSKYLQARVGDSFKNCKKILDQNRLVLFSGTSCQISGLKHYLRKDYQNLLSVDFICHGTPSPIVWRKYIDELKSENANTITKIEFRSKIEGWTSFRMKFDYVDNEGNRKTISTPFYENIYMRAFLSNLILRPSCQNCPAKGGTSGSDITIADFWGIQKVLPSMYDDKGTSLVIINTEKGNKALDKKQLRYEQVALADAIRHNPSYFSSVKFHPNRNSFFTQFAKGNVGVHELIEQCLRLSLMQKIKKYAKKVLRRCRTIIFDYANRK